MQYTAPLQMGQRRSSTGEIRKDAPRAFKSARKARESYQRVRGITATRPLPLLTTTQRSKALVWSTSRPRTGRWFSAPEPDDTRTPGGPARLLRRETTAAPRLRTLHKGTRAPAHRLSRIPSDLGSRRIDNDRSEDGRIAACAGAPGL
jgi:hypothetical protein